jgi:DNA modification methylase
MVTALGFKLRNRVIWHFSFGLHATKRFSGRYETLLWFTKSDDYFFQLDPVRIPQLYPGKRHAKGRAGKGGLPSGNPKGKNPTDFWTFEPSTAFLEYPIWEIPNVKAAHPEKTFHPCQFPTELVERCVLALTAAGDTVLDPFVGTGTSVIAAAKHGRNGIGIDQSPLYVELARSRLSDLKAGRLLTRPMGKPVRHPKEGERVATIPPEWVEAAK